MHMNPIYVILILLGLACTPVSALSFRTIENRHGLSDNYVRDVARDSLGLIWIATQTGIDRFDGHRLKDMTDSRHFTTNPYKIAVDGHNNIWVMTDDSLFVYADGIFDNATTHKGIPFIARSGKHIVPDGRHGLWILKTDSIYYFDYATNLGIGSRMPFIPKDAASFHGGIALLSPDGNLYYRKREDRRVQRITLNGTIHDRIKIEGSRCWFFDGLIPGVDFYDFGNKQDNISQYSYFEDVLIKDIAADNQGYIWFGSNNGGIYRFDSNGNIIDSIRRDNSLYSLSSNHISALFIDDDVLVAGTSKRGVSIASLSAPEFGIIETGIESDISFLHQDNNGKLLVGFDGGGMAVYDSIGASSPIRIYTASDSALPSDLVIGVSQGDGPTLFGTYGGGIFKVTDDGRIVPVDSSDSLRYCRHIISESDSTVWAGTFQNGLFLLGSRNYNKDNSELRSDCITGLSKAGESVVIATSDGLAIINTADGKLTRCPEPKLAEARITSIYTDSRGLLWVGTQTGILIADSLFRIIGTIDISDGLSSGVIRAITADLSGKIWVTTANGISYITVSGNDSEAYSFETESFTENSGLGDISFNRYSLSCTPEGMILAGGFGRYITVNHGIIQPESHNYRAYVTEVYVNGTPVGPGQTVKGGGIPLTCDIMTGHRIELDYYNNLQLAVGSSSPGNAGSIAYESRLDNGEWSLMKSDILVPGELSAGRHTLEVRVSGQNEPTTIEIYIRPPFYKSNGAYAFYVLSALMLCFVFYKHLKMRHKKALGEQRVENAIAREENSPVSPDDKFITDAKKIIESNIEQEDFSVEKMSELLSMSRSGLYKKLTAVTGLTPLEFIRMVRMREGRRLLDSGESSIAQIAYRIGMSPKQFSKYFKDETGLTPSQYLRKNNG